MGSPSLFSAPLVRLRRPPAFPLLRPAFPTAWEGHRISCGPRDKRGKLQRGRILSTEAILAVQALKRAAAGDESNVDRILAADFTRLVKADLLAALAELQRQDNWRLALKIFGAARREPWYKKTDLDLYAKMITTLARCGVTEQIDALVAELLAEQERKGGFSPESDAGGIARVFRALMAAERGELVWNFYREIKRGGCELDEFLYKFLIRGLRRSGQNEAAGEVARDFEVWDNCEVVIMEPLPA